MTRYIKIIMTLSTIMAISIIGFSINNNANSATIQARTQIAQATSPLDAPKSAGLIGERPDGLLGYVEETVPADIITLVESTNARRLEHYAIIAADNNLPLSDVQAVVGERLINEAKAGQYIMDADGNWLQK